MESNKRIGVIVFLDALGVKGVWNRDPNFIENWEIVKKEFMKYTTWSQIYSDSGFRKLVETELVKIGLERSLATKVTPRYNVVFFSDTVIDTASVSHEEYLQAEYLIPFTCFLLMSPFLTALRNKIYFRGAISVGTFYQSMSHTNFDTVLTVGPAVDEAAEYYTLPNWIGVSTAPSATLAIEQNREMNLSDKFFVRYDIPLKTGVEKNGFALAWPALEKEKAFNSTQTKHIQYIEADINAKKFVRKPLSFSVYSKLRNTLEFHDHFNKST